MLGSSMRIYCSEITGMLPVSFFNFYLIIKSTISAALLLLAAASLPLHLFHFIVIVIIVILLTLFFVSFL